MSRGKPATARERRCRGVVAHAGSGPRIDPAGIRKGLMVNAVRGRHVGGTRRPMKAIKSYWKISPEPLLAKLAAKVTTWFGEIR